MDFELIKKKFELIGARVKFQPFRMWETSNTDILIDVVNDKRGEFFEIRLRDIENAPDALVPDIDTEDRHLLLMVRQNAGNNKIVRFLCGHDERQWYVAGVPGNVSTIRAAKEALMPEEVKKALERSHVKPQDRLKRRNKGFIRQGEWFFIPVDISPDPLLIHKNEPISRGRGSTPHIVEFLYREGGVQVWVCSRYPEGLTEEEYREVIKREPELKNLNWQIRTRDARVYARGRVRHKDHKTIYLPDWHLVLMNTESRSVARRNIVFLD